MSIRRSCPCGWSGVYATAGYANLAKERHSCGHHADHALVQRILDGDYALAPDATAAERREVAARWHALGRSVRQLAHATGWKVERYYKATEGPVWVHHQRKDVA